MSSPSPFVTSNGLTDQSAGRSVVVDGTPMHYHDIGEGEPILFLHSYGPGSNAWITWHKVVPYFAARYRCILMDLVNYGESGPRVFQEQIHGLHARQAKGLLDAIGIDRVDVVGNSQGGQTAFAFAYTYPERTKKLVWGAGHVGTNRGYRNEYLMAIEPEEGLRATLEVIEDPSAKNFERYLKVHIDDPALVTPELVEYVRDTYLSRPDILEASGKSFSTPHDHAPEMAELEAETLIIWGRNDRMCTFEIGINALNLTRNSRLVVLRDTGHWVPFEKPAEYAAHVLSFLDGYLQKPAAG
ncbi:alpha/beta fold hydrolase [Pseudonocardia halophobica]|uniref:alpha/beta fold hydrolase n=1 Tax=Pseudonocardia halophobica TaxID=29401 RepID=UPI003D91A3CE